MIARLSGIVLEKSGEAAVLDVQGVGYLVHFSVQSMGRLPPEGARAQVRCYTHVREDLGLLLMHGYRRKGKLFKYPGSVLKDCFGLKGHRVCDRANTGKCRDCLNCLTYLK